MGRDVVQADTREEVRPGAQSAEPTPNPALGVDESGMLRLLWPVMRPKRWHLAALGVVSFLGGMAEASLLVLIANLALAVGGAGDELGDLGTLGIVASPPTMFAAGAALVAVRVTLAITAAHLTAHISARTTRRIRNETFTAYVHASWATQASEEESAVQNLLLHHVDKATTAVLSTSTLISTGLMVVSLTIGAVVVDPAAAALIIACGALLFLVLRPLTTIAKRLSARMIELRLAYVTQSLEAIDLSLEVRSFGVSDAVSSRLEDATGAELRPSYLSQFMSRLVPALYSGAVFVILLSGLLAVYTFFDRQLASLGPSSSSWCGP